MRSILPTARRIVVACLVAAATLAVADTAHAWSWTQWSAPADALNADVSSFVVGSDSRMYASTEGVTLQGVYRQTADNPWDACNSGPLPGGKSRDVHRLTATDDKLFAATSSGLYQSDLAACSWKAVGQAAADPNKKLLGAVQVVAEKGNELWAGMQSGATWRSTDGGQTWNRVSAGFVNGNSETVWDLRYVKDVFLAATGSGVYRLNGNSWVPSSDGLPPNVGVRRFGFSSLGFGAGYVYAATTSEGVYRSSDFGLTWTAANAGLNSGYAKQVRDFAIAGTKMYAATGDGIYAHTNSLFSPTDLTVAWKKVVTPDPPDLSDTITKAIAMWKYSPDLGRLFAGTQSNGVYTVTVIPPVNSGLPVISYDPPLTKGEVLTASDGMWFGDPATLLFAWRRCDKDGNGCTEISGATSKQYIATDADIGHALRVRVSASNLFPTGNVMAESAPTEEVLDPSDPGGPVQNVPINTTPPSISPSTKLAPGQTLKGTPGVWQQAQAYTYVWQRCDGQGSNCVEAASGATQLKLGPGDLGYRFRYVVTAHNANQQATAASGLTDAVGAGMAPKVINPPAISGPATIGSTLNGSAGEWSSLHPLSFDRKWLRCDADGTGCNPVSGATLAQYTTTAADKGKRLQLRVTATDTANQHTEALSAQTAPIGVPPVPPKPPVPVTPKPLPRPAAPRCVVPRLRGLPLKKAKRKLKKAHCRVGTVVRVKTRAVRRGRVVRSSPKRGAKRQSGKRVKLYVRRR